MPTIDGRRPSAVAVQLCHLAFTALKIWIFDFSFVGLLMVLWLRAVNQSELLFFIDHACVTFTALSIIESARGKPERPRFSDFEECNFVINSAVGQLQNWSKVRENPGRGGKTLKFLPKEEEDPLSLNNQQQQK